MAQNIKLLGALYSSVPAVVLPTIGGGTATFYDAYRNLTIDSNGSYDVKDCSTVNIAVPGMVYESGVYVNDNSNAWRPTITFSGSHTTAPIFIGMVDADSVGSITANSNICFMYFDCETMLNTGYPISTTESSLGTVIGMYRTSSGTSQYVAKIQYGQSNSGSSSTAYAKYWTTNVSFRPSTGNSNRYFRQHRAYSWVAIWKP